MEFKVDMPEFISIGLYQKVNEYKSDNAFAKLINTVAAIAELPISKIRELPVDVLTNIANDFAKVADPHQDFHTCFEFEGQLYGYAHIKQTSLGEFVDLEEYAKSPEENLHKIAAILYRPVTKHRFKDVKFTVKQKIKSMKGLVEEPFEYYDIEKYDSETLKERAELFKELPVDIVLGAQSFFLAVSTLYLNHSHYSTGQQTRMLTERTKASILRALENFGGGSEPYIPLHKPQYYQSQETSQ